METRCRKDCSQGLACSLFKSGRLYTNNKLTLYKAPISSVMTYTCPIRAVCYGRSPLEIAAPAEQSTPRYWKT
jgi:hypothetical protein